MHIVKTIDYHGHLWKYPPPQPNIGPCQVDVFLHVKTRGLMKGSKGVIVYSAKHPRAREKNVYLGFDAGFMKKDCKVLVTIGKEITREELRGSEGFNKALVNDLEVIAIIGQNYCPICHFFVGYTPEILSEEMKHLGKD